MLARCGNYPGWRHPCGSGIGPAAAVTVRIKVASAAKHVKDTFLFGQLWVRRYVASLTRESLLSAPKVVRVQVGKSPRGRCRPSCPVPVRTFANPNAPVSVLGRTNNTRMQTYRSLMAVPAAAAAAAGGPPVGAFEGEDTRGQRASLATSPIQPQRRLVATLYYSMRQFELFELWWRCVGTVGSFPLSVRRACHRPADPTRCGGASRDVALPPSPAAKKKLQRRPAERWTNFTIRTAKHVEGRHWGHMARH
jgi:hypothetical protein